MLSKIQEAVSSWMISLGSPSSSGRGAYSKQDQQVKQFQKENVILSKQDKVLLSNILLAP